MNYEASYNYKGSLLRGRCWVLEFRALYMR